MKFYFFAKTLFYTQVCVLYIVSDMSLKSILQAILKIKKIGELFRNKGKADFFLENKVNTRKQNLKKALLKDSLCNPCRLT